MMPKLDCIRLRRARRKWRDPATLRTRLTYLEVVWRARPCFICGRRGMCSHREPEVDLAELEARSRRLRRIA